MCVHDLLYTLVYCTVIVITSSARSTVLNHVYCMCCMLSKDVCRELTCTWGDVPMHGECRKLGTVTSANLLIWFTVKDRTNITRQIAMETTAEAFYDTLTTDWFLPSCLNICDIMLEINSAELFYRAIVSPGKGCSFENMLISLREIRKKNITFDLEIMANISNRPSRHVVEIMLAIRDEESNNPNLQNLHYIFVSLNFCRDSLILNEKMMTACPTINVSAIEIHRGLVTSAMFQRLRERHISSEFDVYGTEKVTICVQDYFNVMQDNDSPVQKMKYTVLVFTYIVIGSVL